MPSFPSGHSAIAVALFGYFIYFLLKNKILCKSQAIILFSGVIIILLIGFSRMYLGVHYLSDVFGGFLIGLLWLIVGITITEVISNKKETLMGSVNKISYALKAVRK